MSCPSGEAAATEESLAQQVIDYLRQHPDLLAQQPDLLGQLELHHNSGVAVSLIERQVVALRRQVERYQHQLGELVGVARDNEQINQRLHRLTLKLIAALDREEVETILEQRLHEDFQAHGVSLRLNPELQQEPSLKALRKITGVRCGRLPSDQLQALFGELARSIHSVALVALHSEAGDGGLLAIGSDEESRFHPGMGTDYLQRLGEIIAKTLEVVTEPRL